MHRALLLETTVDEGNVEMKAFRTFDGCREELRKLRIVFRPDGDDSKQQYLEIGAEGSAFRGRLSKNVCTKGWLKHYCPENAIDFAEIEALCHDDATVMTAEQILQEVAKQFWGFAKPKLTLEEIAFYLLFTTVTRQDRQTPDLRPCDIAETFGEYCLERTLEEVEDVLLSVQE